MAKNTRKCQWCKKEGILDDMTFEMVGKTKPVKKFFHKICHEEYLKDKKFKEKELMELDELVNTIKNIYGVKELPRTAYTLLQNLRNGERVFGNRQQVGKRYKQGYKYSLIKDTFEYCSDTIEYWNSVKNFDSFMSAFKYALTIVIDKIYYVEQREIEKEKKKRMIEKHLQEVTDSGIFESSYKKVSKNTADISDFLDD